MRQLMLDQVRCEPELFVQQGPRNGPPAGDGVSAAIMVIGVDDCQAYYDKSMAAGASEQMPVTRMPGVGTLAYFKDPDGNMYGIIEPEMEPPT